jgi:hypothetical protein
MIEAEDLYDEPSIEVVDRSRDALLAEWERCFDEPNEPTRFQAHQMHMLALMLDLVYWTWRNAKINEAASMMGRSH